MHEKIKYDIEAERLEERMRERDTEIRDSKAGQKETAIKSN